MKTSILSIILILGFVVLVGADDLESKPDAATETWAQANRITGTSPMMAEIKGILDSQTAELNELSARFRNAATESEAWEIQLGIRQLKIDTEIAVMETQHRHLIAAGRLDEATSVAKTLHALRNPDEVRAALAKPEPRDAPQGK